MAKICFQNGTTKIKVEDNTTQGAIALYDHVAKQKEPLKACDYRIQLTEDPKKEEEEEFTVREIHSYEEAEAEYERLHQLDLAREFERDLKKCGDSVDGSQYNIDTNTYETPDFTVVPFGSNKGRKWEELSNATLERSLAYAKKKMAPEYVKEIQMVFDKRLRPDWPVVENKQPSTPPAVEVAEEENPWNNEEDQKLWETEEATLLKDEHYESEEVAKYKDKTMDEALSEVVGEEEFDFDSVEY